MEFYPHCPVNASPAFINPASTITRTRIYFVFLKDIAQRIKMTTILHFVSSKDIAGALPQNAEIMIRIPADAIIATTAGRREPSTP